MHFEFYQSIFYKPLRRSLFLVFPAETGGTVGCSHGIGADEALACAQEVASILASYSDGKNRGDLDG